MRRRLRRDPCWILIKGYRQLLFQVRASDRGEVSMGDVLDSDEAMQVCGEFLSFITGQRDGHVS